MKTSVLWLCIICLSGCQTPSVKYHSVGLIKNNPNCPDYTHIAPGYYGGDGSTAENSVEGVGVDFTFKRWLKERRPDSEVQYQVLVISKKTQEKYNVITYMSKNSQSQKIWFRMTDGELCEVTEGYPNNQ